jgi:hypothetical protein
VAAGDRDVRQAERTADWDTDQIKRKHSPLHQRARTPKSSHGKKRQSQDGTFSDVDEFMFQSFTLLFGDEFQTMPLTLLSIFRGDWKKNFNNRDFLDSGNIDALHLKYIILQSARLAFHSSLESFAMGEMDLPDYKTFEVSCFQYLIINFQFRMRSMYTTESGSLGARNTSGTPPSSAVCPTWSD